MEQIGTCTGSRSQEEEEEEEEEEQKQEEEEENYVYAHPSSSSRCNCAGNKRATLNGLIELFEQQEQVAGDDETADNQQVVDEEFTCEHTNNSTARRNHDNSLRKRMRAKQSNSKREKLSTRERVAKLGVPVLPLGPELTRKLTSTSWAQATDGRQYEHRLIEQRGKHHSSQASLRKEHNQETEVITRIVKHQPSSSRRLLEQLAKLRKLSEPEYRVRRPEKVAQVERLIEELERLTADWEQDESLLERATRRELPERYQIRHNRQREHSPEKEVLPPTTTTQEEDTFTVRRDVEEEEAIAIASAHSSLNARRGYSSLNRRRRQRDDLAARRLSSSALDSLEQAEEEEEENQNELRKPQMSYLLCSGAGAYYNRPADLLETELGKSSAVERHLYTDDLHIRTYGGSTRARARSEDEPEPPFGIPRRPLVGGHLNGGTYPTTRRPATRQPDAQRRSESRVSFASVDSGLVAGDSPTTAGPEGSRSYHQRTESLSSRRAASSHGEREAEWEYADLDECDLGQLGVQEVSLSSAEEEEEGSRPATSASSSHQLELCRAEIRATPSPRRSRIRIEQPRSKSPLVRVGPALAGTTCSPVTDAGEKLEELECHYQFEDDDDDDGDDDQNQVKVDKESSRIREGGRSSRATSSGSDPDGPKFSIGHYEWSRRSRRLTILP